MALAAVLTIDILLGEPPPRLHPTVWMGRVIDAIRSKLGCRSPRAEKLWGVLMALTVITLFTVPAYLALSLTLSHLGLMAYTMLAAIMLKPTLAIRSMCQHTAPILTAIKQKKLNEARTLVSRIVGRKTENLGEEHVISATVESIGEGTVDGVTSPIFYFALLGVPGALAYRAINTLDSMVGYKRDELANLGAFSAHLDTVANYVPARITALLMVLAAMLLTLDWRRCLTALKRDRAVTQSLNSGWPMSSMAGALGIWLEKPGFYILGAGNGPPRPQHIPSALTVMGLTTCLFVVFVAVPINLIVSLIVGG